jgi:hypothetical protein
MANCHALSLWQDILWAIIGSVDAAYTQYEADCLNWQSIITDGHKLLSKAGLLQFKELCDNNYFLCEGEYDLYKEWAQVIEAKPRYMNIMSGIITDKDEQAWNNDKNHFDNYSDNNRMQAFFLGHYQMLAYYQWLSFCPEGAALFCNFEVSKSVCLVSIIMKMSHKEFT